MDWMKDVEAIEGGEMAWLDTYTAPAADAATAEEMTKTRAEFTRNGFFLASEDAMAAHEEGLRKRRDKEGHEAGVQLEIDRDLLAQRLGDDVAAAEPLPSLVQRYAGTPNSLQAIIADGMLEEKALRACQGRTRMQLLNAYEQLDDRNDVHVTSIRLIEGAVLAGETGRLGLNDDPESDATALPRLQAAVKARRQARVPKALLEAHARLSKGRPLQLSQLLGHLRSGRGIAHRPKPALVAR